MSAVPDAISRANAAIAAVTVAELEADPHGVLRRCRALAPFVAHEAGGYLVLRAAGVELLLHDPRARQSETEYPTMRGITDGPLFQGFEHGMVTANDAAHRRRRSPFTRLFAARLIAELRPRIRQSAAALIDGWIADGEIDFVDRFAAALPAQVISDLLGLPREDIPRFTRLVYSVTRAFTFIFAPEELPEMQADAGELIDYVAALLDRRRNQPAEDFLTGYLAEADRRGELSRVEIIVQIVVLIIGGTDTTRVALAVQVALLLRHREQWDAVCADRSLISGAVSEALRYEPSVASATRHTVEDIELDGQVLPGGSFVMLSTLSALRDERVYACPDVFDIRRTDHPRLHPVFGGGPHRCLGEALARAELEEGLTALAARLPGLRLVGEMPLLRGHSGIRRIGDMRVSWSD